jgi:hypothetical protein
MVMEVYQAADKSAEDGRPVELQPAGIPVGEDRSPLTNSIAKATADRR